MRYSERVGLERRDEERQWPPRRGEDYVGPQGPALILELRRLQAALAHGNDEVRGPHANGDRFDDERAPRPAARKPAKTRKGRRRRKGAARRALDLCLQNLWFNNRPRAAHGAAQDPREHAGASATSTQRGKSEVRAHGAFEAARERAGDTRPEPGSTARAHHASPSPTIVHRMAADDETRSPRRDQRREASNTPPRLVAEPPAARAAPPHERPPANDIRRGLQDDLRISLPDRADGQPAGAAALVPRPETLGRAVATCKDRLGAIYGFLVTGARGTTVEAGPDTELAARVGHSFEGELRSGLRVLIMSVGIMGSWATLVPLSSAVVAPGALVVESKLKKVQHPTGGVVAQINVHDGDHVAAGDLVARLDETQARANQQMLANQLAQVRMRIARMVAERDGADELKGAQGTPSGGGEDAQLLASEKSLFNARTVARKSQKELLRSHVSQLGEQIAGFEAQIKSKAAQIELIAGELQGVQGLYDKGLVPLTRLTTLQREAARLDGERGQLTSAIAEAKSKISEAEIQILRTDQDFRSELMKDLREAMDKEAELVERNVAAKDTLNRIDIRAPTTGIVHQLSVYTIGGVIAPGEVIMEIVPDSDDLEIEVRLPPQDIDQVRPGQTTFVRFSAFNQRTTPQLKGLVSYVSADLAHDKQNNAAYYTVRVTLPGEERRRLNGLQLVSGMPAEVFLQTGSRSMMSYLFKPMSDQFQRMFTER